MIFYFLRGPWFLFISAFTLCDLHAQPVMARSAVRLMGATIGKRVDSAHTVVWVPGWYPVVEDESSIQVGVCNRYGMNALTETFLRLQRPLGSGTFQGSITSVGNAGYRMSAVQVGMNKKLLGDWCIRLEMGATQVHASGYGNRWSPQVHVSMAGSLDVKTQVGMQWENPQVWMGAKSLSSYASPRIRVGLSRTISEQLALMGWMDWERASVPGIFLQCLYRPTAFWSVDVGWGRSPDQICLGAQRALLNGIIRTSFSQDPLLGASFLFSYRYVWSVKKNNR